MVDESSPPLPPAEEPLGAETDITLEPEAESGESISETTDRPGFVCECEAEMRSACKGLPFYKEHKSRRFCVLHYPCKEKSADFKEALDGKLNSKDFDFRGVWFPDAIDFSNFEFCAAAYFSDATFTAAADFTAARFTAAADFSSATFEAMAGFGSARFETSANFTSTAFYADTVFNSVNIRLNASFEFADFRSMVSFTSATFSGAAYFHSAKFIGHAYFNGAAFGTNLYFSLATFKGKGDFGSATFGADAVFSHSEFQADADFRKATFAKDAYFSGTLFNDRLSFSGTVNERTLKDGTGLGNRALGLHTSVDLQHARFERPHMVSFHTLVLRPHWFVNMDSRSLIFTDVRWNWDGLRIRQEIEALAKKGVAEPHRLLVITCRHLAENAEANNRYEEASRFRYWAMELARHTKWRHWTFWKTDWLHMLYWAVSGYGERILRALGVLAGVWFVFVLLYTRVGFVQQLPKASNEAAATAASMTIEDRIGQPLDFSRALTYSLGVMSLQKPDPRPLTNWAHTLVTLETILGPLQAALLALAIRRKFMR